MLLASVGGGGAEEISSLSLDRHHVLLDLGPVIRTLFLPARSNGAGAGDGCGLGRNGVIGNKIVGVPGRSHTGENSETANNGTERGSWVDESKGPNHRNLPVHTTSLRFIRKHRIHCCPIVLVESVAVRLNREA